MDAAKRSRLVAILEIITAIGIVLFWIGFFTIGLAPDNPPPCYFAYEHSFPLPDIILAGMLLVAGTMTLRGYPGGRPISHACAGALMFLGALDFSFNFQNGIYLLSTIDLILNGFINFWCVGLGLTAVLVALD
jgi:hypothetical protein